MGVARGLVLVLVAVATLGVICALTWMQDAGLDEMSARAASTTPASSSKAQGAQQKAALSHEHAPAPPEVVVLAPRGGLVPPPTWGSHSSDRLPLAQQLQRELARVGCYEGEINGVWTPATRRALKAFMDRVNAVLPTEAPDRIQLALVEAARERVCGSACPAGETLAEGRCLPNVVLAGRRMGPGALPDNARADPSSGSAAVAPMPLPADRSRTGFAPALTGPPQTATGIAPQAPAAAPSIARAAEARRRQGQSSFFGLTIFKPFEKLGF
jgi:hypothetical protein